MTLSLNEQFISIGQETQGYDQDGVYIAYDDTDNVGVVSLKGANGSLTFDGSDLTISGASGSSLGLTNSSLSIGQSTSGYDQEGIFLGQEDLNADTVLENVFSIRGAGADANFLTWDGTDLNIKGDLVLTQKIYTYAYDGTSGGSYQVTQITYNGTDEETHFGANGISMTTGLIVTESGDNYWIKLSDFTGISQIEDDTTLPSAANRTPGFVYYFPNLSVGPGYYEVVAGPTDQYVALTVPKSSGSSTYTLSLAKQVISSTNYYRLSTTTISHEYATNVFITFKISSGWAIASAFQSKTLILDAVENNGVFNLFEAVLGATGITSVVTSVNGITGDITGLLTEVTAADIDSESATNTYVLTANGSGAASWQPPTSTFNGGTITEDLTLQYNGPTTGQNTDYPSHAIVFNIWDDSNSAGTETESRELKVNTDGDLTFDGTVVSLSGHGHTEYLPKAGGIMTGALVLRGQQDNYDGQDRSTYWDYDSNVALALEPAADNGATAIIFKSIGNSPSDFAYIVYDEDYGEAGVTAGENGVLLLSAQNDGIGSSDHVRVKGRFVVEADTSSSDPTNAFEVKASNVTTNLFHVPRAGEAYVGTDKVFHDGYHPNADAWTAGITLTIGSTGKSVNGSENVTWTLADIGVDPDTFLKSNADDTATGNLTFEGNFFAKNVDFVGGTSYNENIRMHPGTNDYSSIVLGAVSGTSGTGVGQWTLVRYPTASTNNKFSIRHNATDMLVMSTSGAATFTSTVTATNGKLASVEYNGTDQNKVNFELSGTTLTITTS
jgi:hypothetical protein